MAAPDNPYRTTQEDKAMAEGWTPMVSQGSRARAEERAGVGPVHPRFHGAQLVGSDLDAIASRAFHDGIRMHAADTQAELDELRRLADEKPVQAYDEGYDRGNDDGGREVVDTVLPAVRIAHSMLADATAARSEKRRAEGVGEAVGVLGALIVFAEADDEMREFDHGPVQTARGFALLRGVLAAVGEAVSTRADGMIDGGGEMGRDVVERALVEAFRRHVGGEQ